MKDEIKCSVCKIKGYIGKYTSENGICTKITNSKKYGAFFCYKHYQMMKNYGCIHKIGSRDLNEIIINEDICKMYIHKNIGTNKMEVLFNTRHLEKIKNMRWGPKLGRHGNYYVRSRGESLHNIIMGKQQKPYTIDHIDGNGLNNLDSNLRICTLAQNAWNKGYMSLNKSGIIGVSKCAPRYRHKEVWVAYLYANGIRVLHKRFYTREKAVNARLDAEKEYHKEFSNKVNKKYYKI